MPKRADLLGKRFGRLVAVECLGPLGASIRWRLVCDCGGAKVATASNVLKGDTKSCGCLHKEAAKRNGALAHASAMRSVTKHGQAARGAEYNKEYNVWLTMRQRCKNQNSQRFSNYGARGISVCERWDSFDNFLADMGPRPSPNHSIDRIDNDGNYEPENCRWATASQQRVNQRPRSMNRGK